MRRQGKVLPGDAMSDMSDMMATKQPPQGSLLRARNMAAVMKSRTVGVSPDAASWVWSVEPTAMISWREKSFGSGGGISRSLLSSRAAKPYVKNSAAGSSTLLVAKC